MTLPAPVLLHPDDLAWRELAPGSRLAVLQRLPNGGRICRIQGAPGSTFPAHTHWGGESVYVLSGDYTDPSGTYQAGDWLVYAPDSSHEPWTIGGCDLLVIAWGSPPAV